MDVDDPYKFATAGQLSLFRRPLPSTNLRFLTAVMWEGRESFAGTGTTPISTKATFDQNTEALLADLMDQANSAVTGHAQGAPLSDAQRLDIVSFEIKLATAQQFDQSAGPLATQGALGGAENLVKQPFYVTINDVLGADVQGAKFNSQSMTLYPSRSRPSIYSPRHC